MKLIARPAQGRKQLLFGLLAGFFLLFFLTPSFWCFSQSQKSITSLYSSYLKGLRHFQEGNYQAALEAFQAAKAKDPGSVHLSLKIAASLIRLDKIPEAEKILLEAKKNNPDSLDISLVLIFVYSLSHNDQQMEEEYEHFLKKAQELKPKNLGISEYLAQFYFYKKKPAEAIAIYEKILEINPKHVEALFWVGYLYDQAGRRKEAIEAWKRGLAVDGAYAPILNSLGYAYALKGENLEEAEKMVKKALEQEPENGAYLDSLGWIYFKQGDLEKAKEYLEKAITNIKDPEIYEHLGDLYLKLNQPEEAITYYKEGLAHFPDYNLLKKKVEEYERENKPVKK